MSLEYVGPFKHWDVVVNGHAVPFLTATPRDDGGVVSLHLDRRFVVDLTAAEAEEIVPFIADCIAIASGMSCHPRLDMPEPPPRKATPRMTSLDLAELDPFAAEEPSS